MSTGRLLQETYTSMHVIGEHILAAARHRAVGRIGLEVVEGGIATPPFGDADTVVALLGPEIVVTSAGVERSVLATTLRAAGELVGFTPGAPTVYSPATPCDLDAPLTLEPSSLKQLVDWYTLASAALHGFAEQVLPQDPPVVTLWPEHFDVALRVDDVNYGGLGGDAAIPEPYLYVGPTQGPPSTEPFWNTPFGAARTWQAIDSIPAALAFFREGRVRFLQAG